MYKYSVNACGSYSIGEKGAIRSVDLPFLLCCVARLMKNNGFIYEAFLPTI